MTESRFASLHSKLNFLLKGHKVQFNASEMDPTALDTVEAEVDAIVSAHKTGHWHSSMLTT